MGAITSGLQRAAPGHQRLLRPARPGLRPERPARALGGRDGRPAGQHPGRDRDDPRGGSVGGKTPNLTGVIRLPRALDCKE